MKLLLAQYAFGRMLLYVGCALRGGNARLHLAGCRRELGLSVLEIHPRRLMS